MTVKKKWLDVDVEGLGKIIARRPVAFALLELLQNALDAPHVRRISLSLQPVAGSRLARLACEDDAPDGFARLTDAYTLYAPSAKAGEATQRGRFNAGEKYVVAMCRDAKIVSTRGSVVFDADGTRRQTRVRRDAGSSFEGHIRANADDLAHCEEVMRSVLVPAGVEVSYNGQPIVPREPIGSVELGLPTELADAEGAIRPTIRRARVDIHAAHGSTARLYELGLPVCDIDGPWDLDVRQKVPLPSERDRVSPSFELRVLAGALDAMNAHITPEMAASTWMRRVVSKRGDSLLPQTIRAAMEQRFGAAAVTFDPSDTEAVTRSALAGAVVVSGGMLSPGEWQAVRRVEGLLPAAGRVRPTPRPFSADGQPLRCIDPEKWTPALQAFASLVERLAPRLIDRAVDVRYTTDVTWGFQAAYVPGLVTFNVGRLGRAWFEALGAEQLDLLLHELAHDRDSGGSGNHVSEQYHNHLSRLGARMTWLALSEPHLFQMTAHEQPAAPNGVDAAASDIRMRKNA